MPASETAHPLAVELFVELALANVFRNDLGAALLEQVIIAKTSLVVNGMGQIGSAETFI